MTVLERIQKIGERWFLTEPLLFAAYCSHRIVENGSLDIPMRTGNKTVEFSPKILDKADDLILAEFLKFEMFRILLKHPYQRQPPFASKELLTKASNITIADVYELSPSIKKRMSGTEMLLPRGLCFEEYYRLLREQAEPKPNNEGLPKKNSQKTPDEIDPRTICDKQVSELWEEDEEACCDINGLIEIAIESNTWGSIAGRLQGIIKASLKVEMDYRRMLSLFKTSVISSKRNLTRMRPNRRFGFEAMGSRYQLCTNLLIAVDVSGSVTNKSLSFFFSVINRLFKYGVQKLDVLQFDTEIKEEPEEFKKARKSIKIKGRGGTDFQPVANYYCKHPEYDGLIFFTDGEAPPPTYNTKRALNVLWVLCGKKAYAKNVNWIKKLKRNRATYIPRSE